MATQQEQEEYEKELGQFNIPIKANEAFSQINRTELPGVEALTIPGRRDGQTLMVNNDNEIEVYQWDLSQSKWIKIGVAVGSSDAAGKREKVSYLGKEYDYVFDIELDDSGRKLKLPYNVNEDPYFAAQHFIHRHELDQSFLDQIAHFIIKNTQSETIAPSATSTSTYYDPFTGEGRYVPPPSNTNGGYGSTGNSTGAVDPFTGIVSYKKKLVIYLLLMLYFYSSKAQVLITQV
jgi:phospholipase A-2-activating protein